MSENEQLAISRQGLREQVRQRRTAVIATVVAILALIIGVVNMANQSATAKKVEKREQEDRRQAQEDRKAADEEATRAKARDVHIYRGVDDGGLATIDNRNKSALDYVVLRIVRGSEERYARIRTLKGCTTWEVSDARLRKEGLRPFPDSNDFVKGSKIQTWFMDEDGRSWTKEPGKETNTEGAYKDTVANKPGKESPHFLDNSVKVVRNSFRPIEDC